MFAIVPSALLEFRYAFDAVCDDAAFVAVVIVLVLLVASCCYSLGKNFTVSIALRC